MTRRSNPALKQFQKVKGGKEEGTSGERAGNLGNGNEHSAMKTFRECFYVLLGIHYLLAYRSSPPRPS